MRAQQPILPIVDQRIFADVRQIAAHQREMMVAIRLPNLANPLEGGLVADMTAERIARIRRINDDRSAPQRIHRLPYVAALRRDRMQLQVDAHGVGYDTRMNQLLEWTASDCLFRHLQSEGHLLGHGGIDACLRIAADDPSTPRRQLQDHAHHHDLVVLILGAATLLLRDQRFIQWKFTVLMGLTSAVFVGSLVVGKQPLVRRLLEAAFPEPLAVSARAWLTLNLLWAAWFAAFALLNIYVAKNFAVSLWMNFHTFWLSRCNA